MPAKIHVCVSTDETCPIQGHVTRALRRDFKDTRITPNTNIKED